MFDSSFTESNTGFLIGRYEPPRIESAYVLLHQHENSCEEYYLVNRKIFAGNPQKVTQSASMPEASRAEGPL
jgi:hypothetical protein